MRWLDSLAALRQTRRQRSNLRPVLPIALLVGAFALAAVFGLNVYGLRSQILRIVAATPRSIMIGFALGLLPLFICMVQTVTRKRLLSKLDSVEDYRVAQTLHYETARRSVDAISPATLNTDYIMPIVVLFLLNAFGFAFMYDIYPDSATFATPNIILGGLQVLDPAYKPENVQTYQAGTFVMMAAAFIGSYVYMIGRLIERLGNNDLYPISLYFYVVRAIIAVSVAAILRHTADSLYVDHLSALMLLAFITGLAPDLFLLAMARKAFQSIKVMGNKQDPPQASRPIALPLIMIDDLTREKVDRLSELGIDSAQLLACQNPFLIWMRLPYDLGLVVQWIAAAQLYTLVKEKTLLELRNLGMLTIFDLECRLEDTAAAAQICKQMGIPESSASVLKKQLDADPCFVRLKQVRDAMADTRPIARAAAPRARHGTPYAGLALEPLAAVEAAPTA